MVTEVLARQAGARAKRTGESLVEALRAVLQTEAGRRLGQLRDGVHRDESAKQWQPNLPRERAEERRQGQLEERRRLREEEYRRTRQAAWESFMRKERRELKLRKEGQLAEAGDRPDLGVVEGEQVLPDAPQGLKHHGAGDWQDREGEHETLDLPPYRRLVRPGLEFSQARAPEFEEDLRREGRGSGATDAPEHLPGTLTPLRLPPVQGVDEHVGVHHTTSGHPSKDPHTRSS
jgi:hypothetical protein